MLKELRVAFLPASTSEWPAERHAANHCSVAGKRPAQECRQRHQTAHFVEDLPDTARRRSFRKSIGTTAPANGSRQVNTTHFAIFTKDFCRTCHQ